MPRFDFTLIRFSDEDTVIPDWICERFRLLGLRVGPTRTLQRNEDVASPIVASMYSHISLVLFNGTWTEKKVLAMLEFMDRTNHTSPYVRTIPVITEEGFELPVDLTSVDSLRITDRVSADSHAAIATLTTMITG